MSLDLGRSRGTARCDGPRGAGTAMNLNEVIGHETLGSIGNPDGGRSDQARAKPIFGVGIVLRLRGQTARCVGLA